MSLTEKELILAWVENNYSEKRKAEIFGESNSQESYYLERVNDHCIEEYAFDTVVELKNQLEELWAEDDVMQEIILPVAGSCFKEHVNNEKRKDITKEEYKELPEFVYVF